MRLASSEETDNEILSSELGGVESDFTGVMSTEHSPVDIEEGTQSGNHQTLLDGVTKDKNEEATKGNDEESGNRKKDLGEVRVDKTRHMGQLHSRREETLDAIYKVIGHETVMFRDLEFAPPWIVQESYEKRKTGSGCMK